MEAVLRGVVSRNITSLGVDSELGEGALSILLRLGLHPIEETKLVSMAISCLERSPNQGLVGLGSRPYRKASQNSNCSSSNSRFRPQLPARRQRRALEERLFGAAGFLGLLYCVFVRSDLFQRLNPPPPLFGGRDWCVEMGTRLL